MAQILAALAEQLLETALAVHSDPRRQTRQGPQPIVATQFYGPGRVLFVASDSTWRWRFGGARAFEQFWSQAVRYITQGRLLGGMKRLVLTTDHDEYSLGQRMTVRAKAFVRAYYGTAPKTSYWDGCSTGGRQGLVAAQRYLERHPDGAWALLDTGQPPTWR